jgi:protein TonB
MNGGAQVRAGEEARPAAPDSWWLKRHLASIQRRIQHRMDLRPYPLQARRMWWTGKAEVTFVIVRDGSVRDVRVTRSTGHEVLDRRAVETVLEAAPYPRPPVDQEVVVPFLFRLM